MPKSIRYVLYGRVSSIKQRDEETIEMQQDALHSFAKNNNLIIAGEYYDEAQSGSLPFADRVEGKRLLSEAKSGKFDAVLFYRTDRLGRSTFEGLRVCQQLTDMNVAIRSISENYDTSTPEGKFMFTMLLAMAENELSTIKKRMNDGRQRKLRRGIVGVFGRAPYGYKFNTDQHIIIDADLIYGNMTRANIVQMIFKKTAMENFGSQRMANYLNRLGVPAPTPQGWKTSTILQMIKNEKYKGLAVFNRESKMYDDIITIDIPAIVTPELWKAANDSMKPRQLFNRHENNPHHYLLNQGLIRCGLCGYAYTGVYYKDRPASTISRFYKCSGKSRSRRIDWGDRQPCTQAKPVPADWIETIVWAECKKILKDKKYAEKILQSYYADKIENKKMQPAIDDVKKNIQRIKKERRDLIDLRLKDIITDEDLADRLGPFDAQIKDAEMLLAELNQQDSINPEIEIRNTKKNLELLRQALLTAHDFEARRAIVQALVHSVVVNTKSDNTIDIDINMNFGSCGLGSPFKVLKKVVSTTTASVLAMAANLSNSLRAVPCKIGSHIISDSIVK
jgi:site-specific DNA recombinase